MLNNLYDSKYVDIYIDENNNIAVSPICEKLISNDGNEIYEYLPSIEFYELRYPYSYEDVAKVIEKGIKAYNNCVPYIGKMTIEEYYYKIKGFKAATYRKKLITIGWDDIGGKNISISIPTKRGKYYMDIISKILPDDSDWNDFSRETIELINTDLTKTETFRTFKEKLNW